MNQIVKGSPLGLSPWQEATVCKVPAPICIPMPTAYNAIPVQYQHHTLQYQCNTNANILQCYTNAIPIPVQYQCQHHTLQYQCNTNANILHCNTNQTLIMMLLCNDRCKQHFWNELQCSNVKLSQTSSTSSSRPITLYWTIRNVFFSPCFGVRDNHTLQCTEMSKGAIMEMQCCLFSC